MTETLEDDDDDDDDASGERDREGDYRGIQHDEE
jgi:hypothetical protein